MSLQDHASHLDIFEELSDFHDPGSVYIAMVIMLVTLNLNKVPQADLQYSSQLELTSHIQLASERPPIQSVASRLAVKYAPNGFGRTRGL